VISVAEIAGHRIATSHGPLTKQLNDLFAAYVTEYVDRRVAAVR